MKIKDAQFIKSGVRPVHYPELGLPEVAFAGRSNAGKSSLMNAMMQRKKLVKVSSTPGRTQLLSWFTVNDAVALCDLPGYGFAKVPRPIRESWGKMVGDYLERREELLALAIITDVRRGFEDDDLGLMMTAGQLSLQPILIATKCDKLKRNALQKRKNEICSALGATEKDIVWFSAVSGMGRDRLWNRINGLLPTGE